MTKIKNTLTENPREITEIFVQCPETGQVAKIKHKELVCIQEKTDVLLFPPGKCRIFEIAIFENVPDDYIHALVNGNAHLGKKAYEQRISKLINAIL